MSQWPWKKFVSLFLLKKFLECWLEKKFAILLTASFINKYFVVYKVVDGIDFTNINKNDYRVASFESKILIGFIGKSLAAEK